MNNLIPFLAGLAFVAVVGGAFWWVIVRGGRRVDEAAELVRESQRRDASITRDIEEWRAGR